MTVNRRQFLKLSAGATLAGAFGGLGISLAPSVARAELQKLQWAKQTTSVCCYCAVGCGLIVHTAKNGEGRAVNVEGDPDHPINEGALCPKGGSIFQLGENDARPKKPLYRAPNSGEWKEVEWDWALSEIAKRVKKTRDASFQTANAKGEKVNRTETIASLGSAALDNEECWAYQVILRSLGLVFIEHQARICHSSTVPALAETYGRGAMTNHWNDIANSDCVLIMGSNAAENHPISFKWVMRAKDRGATIVHVDPRFTRTASKSDIYAPMRSGIDIAFLGGLIKYILDNKLYFEEYVREYTNASLIVGEKFSFKDGLFSGFDAEKRKYDKSQWAFELDGNGVPKRDPSLKHPRCVFNLMKKHYERYTPEQVSNVTGTPKDQLLQVYKTYAATGKPDKAGTIMYAMGWTQHTVGVQNIRTMAMVQLLLGNIGVAGGGVNALRGESNVQGSTDQGLLAHIWPGYNPTPTSRQATLDEYNAATPLSKDPKSVNWWQNRPKYVASYLKAIYPGLSPAEAYDIMPKVDADKASTHYFWLNIFDRMDKGEFKGAFAWGMNPACGGANAGKNRRALGKLDWLVNVNIFENETSSFWKGPGTDPKAIGTEVFFLPCAVSIEKEGSIVNSGRWMQWRYRGPKPWGDTKPDGDIMLEMMHKIRDLYAKEGGAHPDPILKLNVAEWEEHNEFSPTKVARLMNGYFLKDTEVGGKQFKAGQMVPAFAFLTADGSTCSGNWLHAGSFTDAGNMMARRDTTQTPEQARIGLFPNWSFCWPVNRRIIYNRASVDKTGKPWNPAKAVIEWKDGKWVGDVVDGAGDPGAKHPFIMQTHGFGALYGPGREDGPFPEHYEPMEGPIAAHPFSKQRSNPVAFHFADEKKAVADPKYPYICSTYRVTEHWQTGLMTRRCAWLVEAQPQVFCEMGTGLAKQKGIRNGDTVRLSSIRGEVEAVAIVTERIKPFKVMGKEYHMVGLPWHFGWMTPKDGGDSANLITPSVGDPNTGIPETKAFMVDVRKA